MGYQASSGTGQPSGKSGGMMQPPPVQGQANTLMSVTPPGQAQNTVTSGQPIMGQPNQYMNTVGANTQPLFNNQAYQPPQQHGKGKG